MPYADRDAIQARSMKYITEDTATAPKLEAGQAYADAEVNSRLAAKGAPFSDPCPPKVMEISADLAAYFILLDLFQSGMAEAPVEYALHLKERADKDLERLAEGDASLVPDASEEVPEIPPSGIFFNQRTAGVLSSFDGVTPPRCYPLGDRRWL